MIRAEYLCHILQKLGFNLFSGVPCSILKPVINYIIDNPQTSYIAATSEGEAMGIAAGAALAGEKAVVMMQNSGLGNAINPLTSLQMIYKIPALLLITLRGEPGKPDEPQHKIMGKITDKLLQVMGIYYEYLVDKEEELGKQISRLARRIHENSEPVALIIRKGTIEEYELKSSSSFDSKITMKRKEAIKCIVKNLQGKEAIISTTGKVSRELYYDGKESETNFYVVGSMGCASSIGFGVVRRYQDRKVIVLDGDGAVLMKMGTLATIGHYRPKNLIHIVLDNNSHDSTGGQPTVSNTAELEKIALYAGYVHSVRIYSAESLRDNLLKALKTDGPHFLLVKVKKGADKNLGRPKLTSLEIKDRFMKFLQK